MLFRLRMNYNRGDYMYYDFTELVKNTNTIILQNNQIIACLWVTFSVLVCALVLNFYRSVKK